MLSKKYELAHVLQIELDEQVVQIELQLLQTLEELYVPFGQLELQLLAYNTRDAEQLKHFVEVWLHVRHELLQFEQLLPLKYVPFGQLLMQLLI